MYKTRVNILALGSLVFLIVQASANQITPNIPSSVNDLTTFEPIKSTFRTSTNTTGCPPSFRGKFIFLGKIINNTSDSALSDLRVEVERLTRGNLLRVDGNVLQNDDGGGEGIEAPLSVAVIGPSDAAPGPTDFVDVPFEVCLKRVEPFTLQLNVLAEAVPALVDSILDNPDKIQEFLDLNLIDSPAKFLERLPVEYKQHWIMVTLQESAQKSSPTEPRLLLPSKDSSKVFGFCTGKPCRDDKGDTVGVIEYIRFEKPSNKFRFTNIDFPDGKPAVVEKDPPLCMSCHSNNLRPNWDAYDNWTNMLPFNRDRIYKGSQEEEAFIRLLEHLEKDPIIKHLKLPEWVTRDPGTGLITIMPDFSDPGGEKTVSYIEESGLPKYTGCDPTTNLDCKPVKVMQGGNFLTLHHSAKGSTDEGRGVALFDQFSGYNAKRVAQELIDFPNDPMVNPKKVDIRPIALAIADGCVTAANLSDFASKTAQKAFREFHNVSSFGELLTKTNEARHSLPQKKANLQAINLLGLITENKKAPGGMGPGPIDPTPENITKEVARRSLSASPLPDSYIPDTVTGFMIDREDYSENETIALFRFFLEPWKVNIQSWSMGIFPAERNLTYTFADIFSSIIMPPYRSEIRDRLRAKLQEEGQQTTCEALAVASKQIFGAALPLPKAGALLTVAATGVPLVSSQGPDLVVETIGCNAVIGLEFRTSNVGTEPAEGFRNKIIFISKATGQQVGYPTIPGSDEPALGLEPGESTVLSVAVPTACLAEDVLLEQQGCDVLVYADSNGAVKEPDDANNMGRTRCGP